MGPQRIDGGLALSGTAGNHQLGAGMGADSMVARPDRVGIVGEIDGTEADAPNPRRGAQDLARRLDSLRGLDDWQQLDVSLRKAALGFPAGNDVIGNLYIGRRLGFGQY